MKKLMVVFSVLMLSVSMLAGPVTRQQALSVAKQFMVKKGRMLSVRQPAFRAPRRGVTTEDQSYYYVFNADGGKGFVIVSGDDRTEQILGYSDEGSFDIAAQPEHIRNFLQMYADKIQFLDDTGYRLTPARRRAAAQNRPVRRAIAPLLKSRWNQGAPWNAACPIYYDKETGELSGNHSVTGCVATAYAQAMYYHRWPMETIAYIPQHKVTWETKKGDRSVTLPRVKPHTPIDWDHMYDTYNGRVLSEEDSAAIADFNLWVGQALKMGYGPSSGAVTGYGETVLKKIFNYDDGMTFESRGDYTIDAWSSLIYGELAEARPVVYSGQSSGGGHAFVLDGYDGEGLFHVNWGWGGGSDGYYRIAVLAPGADAGIGSSNTSDGYTMSQGAAIGMKAPDDITADPPKYVLTNFIDQENNFFINDKQKKMHVVYCNWTGSQRDFEMNVATIDEDGTFHTLLANREATIGENYLNTQDYMLSKLPVGIHKVVPVSRVKGRSEWLTSFDSSTHYFLVTVADNGTMTHEWRPREDFTVENFKVISSRKAGDDQEVMVTFKNSGEEFFRPIGFYAGMEETMGEKANSRTQIVMREGETTSTVFKFETTTDQVGKWHVWIINEDTRKVYYQADIDIRATGAAPDNPAGLESAAAVTITNKSGSIIIGPKAYGKVTVKNNASTDFTGAVKVTRWRREVGDTGYYWSNGDVMVSTTIPAGGSKVIEFVSAGLEEGYEYCFSAGYLYGSRTCGLRGLDYAGQLGNGGLNYAVTGVVNGITANSYMVNSNSATLDFTYAQQLPTLNLSRAAAHTLYFLSEEVTVPDGLAERNLIVGGKATSISLTEDGAYVSPVDYHVGKISYTRTFAAATDGKKGWETIVLPFAPTSISADGQPIDWRDGDFYLKAFTYVNADDEVCFETPEVFEANIPYIIGVPEALVGKTITFEAENADMPANIDTKMQIGADPYIFVGNMLKKSLTDILVLNAEGSAFEPVTKATAVKPFRAYFTEYLAVPKNIVICQETTGILDEGLRIKDESNNPSSLISHPSSIYDLQGRRLANNPSSFISHPSSRKGIYIVNGKKIVIK